MLKQSTHLIKAKLELHNNKKAPENFPEPFV